MVDNEYWRDRQVLVTGGNGFVGSHLTKYLSRAGARVTVVSRSGDSRLTLDDGEVTARMKGDLRDPAFANECTRGQDMVVHLASKIAGLAYSQRHPAEMMAYNTVLDLQVLHAAAENGVRSFVYPSGTLVYDEDAPAPIREDAPIYGRPLASCRGASWAKRTFERAAPLFRDEYDIEIWVIRFSNLYGPGDDYDSERAHLIGSVVRSVARNEAPSVWGDGSQLRSYLYIDDAIRALDLWLRHGSSQQPVNIAGQTEVSVREMIERVISISGKPLEPRFEGGRPTGLRRKLLDVSRHRQLTGFRETTSLEEGLRCCYDWYASRLAASCVR